MAAVRPASAIGRALRRIGLVQGRGGDFSVTGYYRNGERDHTYVVLYSRHANEVCAARADEIEQATDADGGWYFRVSVRYSNGRARVSIANAGERVRETPPAGTVAPEEPAQSDTAPEPAPADEPERDETPEPDAAPAPEPAEDLATLRLHRDQAAGLGWSTSQADLVAAAAAGRLYRDPGATLREVPVPGHPGRVVSMHRLGPLVEAGFLTFGEPDATGRSAVRVTADGRHALAVWRRWRPRPVEKNHDQECEKLPPLRRGVQARRLVARALEEEKQRRHDHEVFWAAAERLRAWEDRDDRLWEAWARVNGVRFRLQRRPAGWVPTAEEIEEHRLDPELVAELRADAENPQPKPELPSTRVAPREELPPLEADGETPEQLGLFGAESSSAAPRA
ncbi:hypothetical protein ACWEQC_21990 [Streptomyces shenzhenensis]